MLSLFTRWLADAIIALGCSVVLLGTQLGGYRLKVYSVRKTNDHRVQSAQPHRITDRLITLGTIAGGFLVLEAIESATGMEFDILSFFGGPD